MSEHRPAYATRLDRPAYGERARPHWASWTVLGVISLGGGLGGLVRYGLGVWFPTAAGDFPWPTFAVNVSGCLLIGIVMVLAIEVWAHRVLLRPFLSVGVLGGYTTFSFYTLEFRELVEYPAIAVAALYLAGTVVAALAAVAAGAAITRRLIRYLGRRAAR